MPRLLALTVLILVTTVLGQEPADPFRKVGEATHPPINEMSGIVRSRTYDDVWWVQNDSGDSARIFAIDGKGDVVIPPFLAREFRVGPAEKDDIREEWAGISIDLGANFDWEDLALADGKLYIADMGNNGNARRDMGVYVVNEPNPRAVNRARTLTWLPIRYPDQKRFPAEKWHFDCEAVFVSEGKLHFLTKHRVAGKINQGMLGTKLYRLDTAHADRENVLTLLQAEQDFALPTAADVSPDGRHLAVLTGRALRVFEKPDEGDPRLWLSGRERRLELPRKKTKQAEGVTWDDDETIRICNEQREIFTIRLEDLPPVPPK